MFAKTLFYLNVVPLVYIYFFLSKSNLHLVASFLMNYLGKKFYFKYTVKIPSYD